jgi:3',5'-cyclic AMP phosphodiesterase CpdA
MAVTRPDSTIDPMHIALITDSHLSARAPECVANWHAAASTLASAEVDLTIHLGDITLDGVNHHDELPFARRLVRSWPTPMCCLLGNHDMGTASGEGPFCADDRLRALAAFGTDRWFFRIRGWTLVGINAQLLASDSPEEAAQRDWLEALARSLSPSDRVALFLHRPLWRPMRDDSMPAGRYVPARAAAWLMKGPLGKALRVVFSGHTHQALDMVASGVRHIWVPSSSFVISDALQKPVGTKVVGMGLLSIDAGELEYLQVTPPGARCHELTELAAYRALAGQH